MTIKLYILLGLGIIIGHVWASNQHIDIFGHYNDTRSGDMFSVDQLQKKRITPARLEAFVFGTEYLIDSYLKEPVLQNAATSAQREQLEDAWKDVTASCRQINQGDADQWDHVSPKIADPRFTHLNTTQLKELEFRLRVLENPFLLKNQSLFTIKDINIYGHFYEAWQPIIQEFRSTGVKPTNLPRQSNSPWRHAHVARYKSVASAPVALYATPTPTPNSHHIPSFRSTPEIDLPSIPLPAALPDSSPLLQDATTPTLTTPIDTSILSLDEPSPDSAMIEIEAKAATTAEDSAASSSSETLLQSPAAEAVVEALPILALTPGPAAVEVIPDNPGAAEEPEAAPLEGSVVAAIDQLPSPAVVAAVSTSIDSPTNVTPPTAARPEVILDSENEAAAVESVPAPLEGSVVAAIDQLPSPAVVAALSTSIDSPASVTPPSPTLPEVILDDKAAAVESIPAPLDGPLVAVIDQLPSPAVIAVVPTSVDSPTTVTPGSPTLPEIILDNKGAAAGGVDAKHPPSGADNTDSKTEDDPTLPRDGASVNVDPVSSPNLPPVSKTGARQVHIVIVDSVPRGDESILLSSAAGPEGEVKDAAEGDPERRVVTPAQGDDPSRPVFVFLISRDKDIAHSDQTTLTVARAPVPSSTSASSAPPSSSSSSTPSTTKASPTIDVALSSGPTPIASPGDGRNSVRGGGGGSGAGSSDADHIAAAAAALEKRIRDNMITPAPAATPAPNGMSKTRSTVTLALTLLPGEDLPFIDMLDPGPLGQLQSVKTVVMSIGEMLNDVGLPSPSRSTTKPRADSRTRSDDARANGDEDGVDGDDLDNAAGSLLSTRSSVFVSILISAAGLYLI